MSNLTILFMKNLKNNEVLEIHPDLATEISGGGFLTGTQSLFRSAMYFGVKAYDTALTTLGALAGLGDGIEAGIQNNN